LLFFGLVLDLNPFTMFASTALINRSKELGTVPTGLIPP